MSRITERRMIFAEREKEKLLVLMEDVEAGLTFLTDGPLAPHCIRRADCSQ
jgi:hypothetical protein